MLLNLDEADIWVFWHGKVAVDEAHQDHAGVEEECPVEPKPVYKLRKEFLQPGHTEVNRMNEVPVSISKL